MYIFMAEIARQDEATRVETKKGPVIQIPLTVVYFEAECHEVAQLRAQAYADVHNDRKVIGVGAIPGDAAKILRELT